MGLNMNECKQAGREQLSFSILGVFTHPARERGKLSLKKSRLTVNHQSIFHGKQFEQ